MSDEPKLFVLDVGHGNCAVLVDRNVIVIDAGPGTALLEFLTREGIKKIDTVLISHADEDHIRGLISLVESRTVAIRLIHINSDSLRGSRTWSNLAFLLEDANTSGRLGFHVGLTTNDRRKFKTRRVALEILAPSPGLALKGPGSTDHKGRKLISNSTSVVVRLLRGGKPLVLLPGDIDETGLANMLESKINMDAQVAVFPHHGGGAGSSDLSKFAAAFCRAVAATTVLFSIGRGKHDTPRPEVVAAVRKELSSARIVCTQLSERCASALPDVNPRHIGKTYASGREARKCCGGTITLRLKSGGAELLPGIKSHLRFIAASAPTALCTT